MTFLGFNCELLFSCILGLGRISMFLLVAQTCFQPWLWMGMNFVRPYPA